MITILLEKSFNYVFKVNENKTTYALRTMRYTINVKTL